MSKIVQKCSNNIIFACFIAYNTRFLDISHLEFSGKTHYVENRPKSPLNRDFRAVYSV